MEVDPELLEGLEAAVAHTPENVPLRLHLGSLLLEAGRPAAALEQCAAVLVMVPDHRGALELAARATMAADPPRWEGDRAQAAQRSPPRPPPPPPPSPPSPRPPLEAVAPRPLHQPGPRPLSYPAGPRLVEPPAEAPDEPVEDPDDAEPAGPALAPGADERSDERAELRAQAAELLLRLGLETEPAQVTLADLGGLATIKQWLVGAVLGVPSELDPRRQLGRALRGGLLEYGPPGCGKTFIARAVAGELGASFLPVDLDRLLDLRPGEGQRALHEVFQSARMSAPCLLFLDELDALGDGPNSRRTFSRGVVEQLVGELHALAEEQEGVVVIAASENPWNIDPLLRQSGRFDRRLLVLPPDREARAAIMARALARHSTDLNLAVLAGRTERFSAADLVALCEAAVESAGGQSLTGERARAVTMDDFNRALLHVEPSPPAWFALARDFVLYAGHGGVYDDLLAYLRVRA